MESYDEGGKSFERHVYRCGQTAATATFTKGEDGGVSTLDRFDASELIRLPVQYSTKQKPIVISLILDRKSSIYPKYSMDFEWPLA